MPRNPKSLAATGLLLAALAACSPSRMAANLAGNAMAGGGGVYASEEDPELVLEALPFGLKTMEGLIETAPGNANLRLAAARGFAGYAYLLQQMRAEEVADTTEARSAFDHRLARLFLRGRDHAMAGLEKRHPGFAEALKADRDAALAHTGPVDADLLYWGGAAWSGAIAADKRDLALIAGLPLAAAMVQRTAALDEAFDGGAAQEFLMLYEAGNPGGSLEAAEEHYRRAVALSDGSSAGAHVGFAEAVAVARQDRAAFRAALEAALAVDPNAMPERRLANVLAQRKARRLLEQEHLLFIDTEEGTS
jgi:predicted anti-sigma-YlaC factor YlaD